jgi:hypothetical protein
MMTVKIPPSGIPARFPLEIPRPGDFTTLGGVRVYFIFTQGRPDVFVPQLLIDGEQQTLMDSALGPVSITRIAQFTEPIPAPVPAQISVNTGGSLQPGNNVTIYAWGAQTASGRGALNPDEGGEPSTLTETIEVGIAEVVTWQEWNRMTGGNQGEEGS